MVADKEPGNSKADRLKPFRWRKGQSGNPAGRPPSPAVLSEALRERLGEVVPGDKQGRTYAQKLAVVLVNKALAGSVPAAALICDRIEGKAPQALTGAGGSPLFPTNEGITEALYELIHNTKLRLGKNDVTAERNS